MAHVYPVRRRCWIQLAIGGPGTSTRAIAFKLGNGQVDEYPESWTLPAEQVLAAFDLFAQAGVLTESIGWFNDSGDGATSPNDRDYAEPA
jgi:hypothetical protein